MNFKKRTCKLLSVLMTLVVGFSISVPVYAVPAPYFGMTISSGHKFPINIIEGPDEKLYVAEYLNNRIVQMDKDGKNAVNFNTDLVQPMGMAFDNDGNLLVAELDGRKISKINSAGTRTTMNTFSDSRLSGLTIDSHGAIFALKYSTGSIIKMNKDDFSYEQYLTGYPTQSLVGICIDANDNLYVADVSNRKIIKITPAKEVSDFITGLYSPTGVTFGKDGFLYVSDGDNSIKKFALDGTAVDQFSINSFDTWGLYVDAGGYIYFTETTTTTNLIVGSASTQNSTQLSLTMNTSLAGTKADPSAFTLTGIASNPSVTNAEILGENIILTIDAPMVTTDTNIKVTYTKTGTNDLSTSASSFKLDNFNEMGVENSRSQYQAAPIGLTGVAPTFATGNGKITGTTTAMEFKAELADDSTYTTCSTYETTVTTPATYSVRFMATSQLYVGATAAVIVPPYVAPPYVAPTPTSSDDDSTSNGGGGSTTKPTDKIVLVNGNEEKAGTETKTTVNGVTSVTLNVDSSTISKKIEDVLTSKTDNTPNLIEFSVGSGDNATVSLTGDIVKQLEKSAFNVSINKDKVEYVIPAAEITIENIANILNVESDQLKDIEVEVRINEVSADVLAKYNEIASKQEHVLVAPPVEFEIVAKATGTDGVTRETTVSRFSNYVERIIEIPANVDQSKITTGIVFNADGTYSHVPTVVFEKDGKYYAKLSSLTNSTYSVIYNPITVSSVEGHWAEETVNDMASRLVLTNYTNFDADEAVTRAEFADYIIRALGLYREGDTVESTFKDVAQGNENQISIEKAKEWGIISGYADGTFKPDATVTREEAMVMYAKAMDIANIIENKGNKLSEYTDKDEVSSWATASVNRVVNAEIFNGKGNGVLAPKDTLTQAEALTAVKNLLLQSELINQ